MELDPKVPPYHTSDQTSFAYASAKDRWPVIITSSIDDVHRAVSAASDPDTVREGKKVVADIAKLKYELQHDRALTPLPDDGQPDVASYNAELERLESPTWFNVPWLYAECYLYRRLNTIFSQTQHWRTYDPFGRQKMSTFRSSRTAVLELAARSNDIARTLSAKQPDRTPEEAEAAEKLLFEEMCEVCLWGNATDLSLLTSLTYEDLQKLQGSKARQANKEHVVVDDSSAAFQVLRNQSGTGCRVHIVLDNAGFELYVDLVFAQYLLASGLATNVVLHPKSIPWFVSDALPTDFGALLNALANPRHFYAANDEDREAGRNLEPITDDEADTLATLFQNLTQLHADGCLILRPNRFWTHAGSYWRLPTVEPALWADLQQSALVVFKGDLNYRKLTGDVMWDPATPFAEAIGPLGMRSGIRTLALRTCKADVVVGLPVGKDEELKAMEEGGGDSEARKWAWSGKWAVVQFCDGKAG